VDFAVWCTYKYLNSGAGGVGALYVHEKWTEKGFSSDFPMLKGWWGNDMKTKFLFKEDFEGSEGADMFKLSNPPAMLCAMLMASLDIFSQTSIEEIWKKQFLLTGFLEYLLKSYFGTSNSISGYCETQDLPSIEIITPSDPSQRGSQLSLIFSVPLASVQEELQKRGITCDIRMPNVMRVSPAPLYNSFEDVFNFVNALREVCQQLEGKFLDKVDCMEGVTEASSPGSSNNGTPNKSTPTTNSSLTISSSDSEPDSLAGTNTL
jgi:kynureninase